jgi:hypothetical protein
MAAPTQKQGVDALARSARNSEPADQTRTSGLRRLVQGTGSAILNGHIDPYSNEQQGKCRPLDHAKDEISPAPDVLPLLRERPREVIPSLVYPAANQSAEAQAFASLVFTNPAVILAEISISWPSGLTPRIRCYVLFQPYLAGQEGGEARRVFAPVARRAAELRSAGKAAD